MTTAIIRLGLCLLVLGATGVTAATPAAPDALDALDVAFDFASAIESDAKDRARAQEQVVRDLIALDRLDDAQEHAAAIEGWRRGTAFADLAEAYAAAGRTDDAETALERARSVRAGIRGWQNPRIGSHIARALAAMGAVDETDRLITTIMKDDPQQYTGRAVTTVASAEAARGDFDGAMERLARLEGDRDVYVSWWRTVTYVEIARNEAFDRRQRLAALDAAEAASEAVIGWKRAESLAAVAEEAARLGRTRRARATLETAEGILDDMGEQGLSGPRVMIGATIARAWAAAGERDRAVAVLREVQPDTADLLEIERPGAYGVLGAAYRVAGDVEASRAAYDEAFRITEGLVNARPRALAVVDICRTIGRFDVPLAAADRERLERLRAGLVAPW